MELSLSVDVGSVICIWQRGVEGPQKQLRLWLPQWRVGATFRGTRLSAASARRNSSRSWAGFVSQFVRTSRPTRVGSCVQIIKGCHHELSQAPSTSRRCAPWPPVVPSPLSQMLHELSQATAANKRRFAVGGTADCRSDMRLPCQNGNVPILSRTMILSPD